MVERKHYVNRLGNEKFNNYKEKILDYPKEGKEAKKDFFEIPCQWFQGAIKNWEHHVEITSNKYFKHFGFKNHENCLLYDSNSNKTVQV